MKIFLLCILNFCIFAEKLEGKITKIVDGDTIHFKFEKNGWEEIKLIRLYGIDAPEIKQDYGDKSQKALEKWLLNKDVKVDIIEKDKYDREIAKVYVDDFYINLQMIRNGHAWHYLQYAKDDDDLLSAEKMARKEKLGLWINENPKSPWGFRYMPETVVAEKISEKKIEAVKKTYWVTRSSRKVHNINCRYFKNSVGYESSNPSGDNCKICGGFSSLNSTINTNNSTINIPKNIDVDYKGRFIHTGPRGGRYYINKNGNKTYVK